MTYNNLSKMQYVKISVVCLQNKYLKEFWTKLFPTFRLAIWKDIVLSNFLACDNNALHAKWSDYYRAQTFLTVLICAVVSHFVSTYNVFVDLLPFSQRFSMPDKILHTYTEKFSVMKRTLYPQIFFILWKHHQTINWNNKQHNK